MRDNKGRYVWLRESIREDMRGASVDVDVGTAKMELTAMNTGLTRLQMS